MVFNTTVYHKKKYPEIRCSGTEARTNSCECPESMSVPEVGLEAAGDTVDNKKISQVTTPSPGVDSTDNDDMVVLSW